MECERVRGGLGQPDVHQVRNFDRDADLDGNGAINKFLNKIRHRFLDYLIVGHQNRFLDYLLYINGPIDYPVYFSIDWKGHRCTWKIRKVKIRSNVGYMGIVY